MNDETILRAREVWLTASKIFEFKIVTPYKIIIDGVEKDVFAFVPGYGSPNGTLVELTNAPNYDTDRKIISWAEKNKMFCSFVNVESCLIFKDEWFKDALEDWGKFH